MIEPHGGILVNRFVPKEDLVDKHKEAQSLPRINLNPRQLSDAYLIAQGALSPLEGFMDGQDYHTVLHRSHLTNNLPWTLPITLAVSSEVARSIKEGQQVALADPRGEVVGLLHAKEIYTYDKKLEAHLVYLTTDEGHPGVSNLYQEGELLVGGNISLFHLPKGEQPFSRYYLTPAETRQVFQERGWRTVVGFQTRNPIHRAHEYIQKCALEILDGLLIHPLVGETKQDDIPAEVRMECYEVLVEGYYPPERVAVAVLPAFMRYAGPREAIFHAIVRKNYGCTHFIVGRDHAGVGNYYGPYDAHHIFDEFTPDELSISPLFFENAFYCRRCQGMATSKTCPHLPEHRISLSGTQVRTLLDRGETPPEEFTRPEVAQVLASTLPSGQL